MSNKSIDNQTKKVRQKHNQNISNTGIYVPSGIYFGKVVDINDPDPEKGRVKVHISSLHSPVTPKNSSGVSTSDDESLGYYWCRRVVPYGGVSGNADTGNEFAFGMFGPAPKKGDEVVVAFTGENNSGVLMGVIPKYLPRSPTTRVTQSGDPAPSYETPEDQPDRAIPHPQAEDLKEQGLDDDTVRGANVSEHTRDPSTNVFNISTPNGHSIIMDDGSFEGQQSNLVRIRTAGGAQFMIDDRNGYIYMITRNGNGWFEINRNGDFNIFSGGSVNIHSVGSFNVHSEANINMQADRDMNFKSVGAKGIKFEASRGSIDMYAHTNMNLSADENGNLRIAGNLRQSADRIDLNGPSALAAQKPQIIKQVGNNNVTESISEVVPEREPWKGHIDYGLYAPSGGGQIQSDEVSASPAARLNPNADDTTYPPNTNQYFPSGMVSFQDSGYETRIEPRLLKIVEEIAIDYGSPLLITSGKRPPDSNKGVGSSSQHVKGKAVDIRRRDGNSLTKRDLDIIARLASEKGIGGFGVYPDSVTNETTSFLHLDTRSYKASWGPNYSNSSLPSYAREVLSKYGW